MSNEILAKLDELLAGQKAILERGDYQVELPPELQAGDGFIARDVEGFCEVGLVNQYYEAAAKNGDHFVREALRDPDLPRKFLVYDICETWAQMLQVSYNAARVRLMLAKLGKKDWDFLIEYLRYGERKPGEFLASDRQVTLGMQVGYDHFEASFPDGSREKVVLPITYDETGTPSEWKFQHRAPWTPKRILGEVAGQLKRHVKRLGSPAPEVNFSPFDG